MKTVLVILTIVVHNEVLLSVIAKNDSPVLMKILQSVDRATNDDHLFEVALKLLKSLCVCMRETLRQKEEEVIFNGNTNSLHVDDLSTDGKDVEIYRKIYNSTCFGLRQELANKINSIQNITIDTDTLDEVNCGSNMKNIAVSSTILKKNHAESELQNILFKVLIQTKDLHNYFIRRYNLFGKAKPHVRSNLKHSIIVILTLHPFSKNNDDAQEVNGKVLHDVLNQKSSVNIDIIDAKYDPNDRASEEYGKENIVSDCNLRSVYAFLIESENKNLTKVFKLLRRNETIKIYIDVTTKSNHTDFSRICCNNNTSNSLCKTDFVHDNLETGKTLDIVKPQIIEKTGNYKDTISKIKDLVKLYDKKLEAVSYGRLDKIKLESAKDSECLGTSKSDRKGYKMPENNKKSITRATSSSENTIFEIPRSVIIGDRKIIHKKGFTKHNQVIRDKHRVYNKPTGTKVNILSLPTTKYLITQVTIDSENKRLDMHNQKNSNAIKIVTDSKNKNPNYNTLKEVHVKYKPVTILIKNQKNYIKLNKSITSTKSCTDCKFKDSKAKNLLSLDLFTSSLLSTTTPTSNQTRLYYETAIQTQHTTDVATSRFNKLLEKDTKIVPDTIPRTMYQATVPIITNIKSTVEKFTKTAVNINTTKFYYTQESPYAVIIMSSTVTPDFKVEKEFEGQINNSSATISVFPLTDSSSSTKENFTNKSTMTSVETSTTTPLTVKYSNVLTPDIGLNNITVEASIISNSRISTSGATSNYRKSLTVPTKISLISLKRNINGETKHLNSISTLDKETRTSKRLAHTKNSYKINNVITPSPDFTNIVRMKMPTELNTNPHQIQNEEYNSSSRNGFTKVVVTKLGSSKDSKHITPSSDIKKVIDGTTSNFIKYEQDVAEEYDKIIIPTTQVIKKYTTKPIILDNLFRLQKKSDFSVKKNSTIDTIKSFDGFFNLKTILKTMLQTSTERITAVNENTSQAKSFYKEIAEVHISNTTTIDSYSFLKNIFDSNLSSNITSLTTTSPKNEYAHSNNSSLTSTPPVTKYTEEIDHNNQESRDKRQTKKNQSSGTSLSTRVSATIKETLNTVLRPNKSRNVIKNNHNISEDTQLKTFLLTSPMFTSQHEIIVSKKFLKSQRNYNNKNPIQISKRNETIVAEKNKELSNNTNDSGITIGNEYFPPNITNTNIPKHLLLSFAQSTTDLERNQTFTSSIYARKAIDVFKSTKSSYNIEDISVKKLLRNYTKLKIIESQPVSTLYKNQHTNMKDSTSIRNDINILNSTFKAIQNKDNVRKRTHRKGDAKPSNGAKYNTNISEIKFISNINTEAVPKHNFGIALTRKDKLATNKSLHGKENRHRESTKSGYVTENINKENHILTSTNLNTFIKDRITVVRKLHRTTEPLKLNVTTRVTKNEEAPTTNVKNNITYNIHSQTTQTNTLITLKPDFTFPSTKSYRDSIKHLYSVTKVTKETPKILENCKDVENYKSKNTSVIIKYYLDKVRDSTNRNKEDLKFYQTEYKTNRTKENEMKSSPTTVKHVLPLTSSINFNLFTRSHTTPIINEIHGKSQTSSLRLTSKKFNDQIPPQVENYVTIISGNTEFNKSKNIISTNDMINPEMKSNTMKTAKNSKYFNSILKERNKETTAINLTHNNRHLNLINRTNCLLINNHTDIFIHLKEFDENTTITPDKMYLEYPTKLENKAIFTTDEAVGKETTDVLPRQTITTSSSEDIKSMISTDNYSDKWKNIPSMPQLKATTVVTTINADKAFELDNTSSPATIVSVTNINHRDRKVLKIPTVTSTTQSSIIAVSNIIRETVRGTIDNYETKATNRPVNNKDTLSLPVTTYFTNQKESSQAHAEYKVIETEYRMTSQAHAADSTKIYLKDSIPTVVALKSNVNFTPVNNRYLLYPRQFERQRIVENNKLTTIPIKKVLFMSVSRNITPAVNTVYTTNNYVKCKTPILNKEKMDTYGSKKEMYVTSLRNVGFLDAQNISRTKNYGLTTAAKTINSKLKHYLAKTPSVTTNTSFELTNRIQPSTASITSIGERVMSDVTDPFIPNDILYTTKRQIYQNITKTSNKIDSSIPNNRKTIIANVVSSEYSKNNLFQNISKDGIDASTIKNPHDYSFILNKIRLTLKPEANNEKPEFHETSSIKISRKSIKKPSADLIEHATQSMKQNQNAYKDAYFVLKNSNEENTVPKSNSTFFNDQPVSFTIVRNTNFVIPSATSTVTVKKQTHKNNIGAILSETTTKHNYLYCPGAEKETLKNTKIDDRNNILHPTENIKVHKSAATIPQIYFPRKENVVSNVELLLRNINAIHGTTVGRKYIKLFSSSSPINNLNSGIFKYNNVSKKLTKVDGISKYDPFRFPNKLKSMATQLERHFSSLAIESVTNYETTKILYSAPFKTTIQHVNQINDKFTKRNVFSTHRTTGTKIKEPNPVINTGPPESLPKTYDYNTENRRNKKEKYFLRKSNLGSTKSLEKSQVDIEHLINTSKILKQKPHYSTIHGSYNNNKDKRMQITHPYRNYEIHHDTTTNILTAGKSTMAPINFFSDNGDKDEYFNNEDTTISKLTSSKLNSTAIVSRRFNPYNIKYPINNIEVSGKQQSLKRYGYPTTETYKQISTENRFISNVDVIIPGNYKMENIYTKKPIFNLQNNNVDNMDHNTLLNRNLSTTAYNISNRFKAITDTIANFSVARLDNSIDNNSEKYIKVNKSGESGREFGRLTWNSATNNSQTVTTIRKKYRSNITFNKTEEERPRIFRANFVHKEDVASAYMNNTSYHSKLRITKIINKTPAKHNINDKVTSNIDDKLNYSYKIHQDSVRKDTTQRNFGLLRNGTSKPFNTRHKPNKVENNTVIANYHNILEIANKTEFMFSSTSFIPKLTSEDYIKLQTSIDTSTDKTPRVNLKCKGYNSKTSLFPKQPNHTPENEINKKHLSTKKRSFQTTKYINDISINVSLNKLTSLSDAKKSQVNINRKDIDKYLDTIVNITPVEKTSTVNRRMENTDAGNFLVTSDTLIANNTTNKYVIKENNVTIEEITPNSLTTNDSFKNVSKTTLEMLLVKKDTVNNLDREKKKSPSIILTTNNYDKIINILPQDVRDNYNQSFKITTTPLLKPYPLIFYRIFSKPHIYDEDGQKSLKITKINIVNNNVEKYDYNFDTPIIASQKAKPTINTTFPIKQRQYEEMNYKGNKKDSAVHFLTASKVIKTDTSILTTELIAKYPMQTSTSNQLPTTKRPRTVKYNTYKPTETDDFDLLVQSKSLLKYMSSTKNIDKITLKQKHTYESSTKSLKTLVKSKATTKILKVTEPKLRIISSKIKNSTVHSNQSGKYFSKTHSNRMLLLDPFSKTNMYPLKMMPLKTQRKVMKRIRFSKRKEDSVAKDLYSRRLITPQNIGRDLPMPKRPFFIISKPVTPSPRQLILKPKFGPIDNPADYFRPKPLFIRKNDNLYANVYQTPNEPYFKWRNKINYIQDALKQFAPQTKARIDTNLERPTLLPTYQPKFLRDRIDSIRNYLSNGEYVKSTKRTFERQYFLKDYEKDYDRSPMFYYRRDNQDEVGTTIVKRRTRRKPRTLFFLSPTVTSWWLDDMYLKVRLPLPINSNPGMVFPRRKFAKMEEVADLGALFIDDLLDYKEMLDRGELPLERATSREKGQPLCMEQFYRLLGVCRIPEVGRDRLDLPQIKSGNEEQEELVVVACRNYFYPIPVKAMDRGRLTPGEIQAQILHAMVDASAAPPAPRVGLLTSMNRDQWARAREQLIRDENNRANLEFISRALCILCVDEAGGDRADTDEQTNAMLRAMHGAGTRHHSANRWFDKTVQLIISSDGTVGMCYEHSAAEGVAVIRLAERALARAEVADRPAPPPALLPAPQAMKWNIIGDVQRTIEQAARDLDRAISDLDFKVYTYRGYGREFMKSCKTSPDVYIQLALQYAYYKMYGYLVTTYESASLRRFRNGRVDNIRSAHNGAHAWAAAMCTAETPPLNEANDEGQKKVSFNLYGEQKKLELFEEAARKQTTIMEANILGRGIDNHLLGLREAARESMGELPHLFNDDTYKQMIHFKLSTSQVATTTDGTFMGYGAVVPDGYGCSYNPKKDCVIFCISSFTSSSVTNTEAFRQSLEEALDSMKLMFQARKVDN